MAARVCRCDEDGECYRERKSTDELMRVRHPRGDYRLPVWEGIEANNVEFLRLHEWYLDDFGRHPWKLAELEKRMRSPPLMMAALHSSAAAFEFLMGLDGMSIYCVDKKHGYTPLHVAMIVDTVCIARLILERDKLASTRQDYHEQIPLHIACKTANVAAVRVLLDAGSPLEALNSQWETPLSIVEDKKAKFYDAPGLEWIEGEEVIRMIRTEAARRKRERRLLPLQRQCWLVIRERWWCDPGRENEALCYTHLPPVIVRQNALWEQENPWPLADVDVLDRYPPVGYRSPQEELAESESPVGEAVEDKSEPRPT